MESPINKFFTFLILLYFDGLCEALLSICFLPEHAGDCLIFSSSVKDHLLPEGLQSGRKYRFCVLSNKISFPAWSCRVHTNFEQRKWKQTNYLRRRLGSTKSFDRIFSYSKKLWYQGGCDECVFAGQNVFLGPKIHLPPPECYAEFQHLHLIHVVNCCFQMRFQKKH